MSTLHRIRVPTVRTLHLRIPQNTSKTLLTKLYANYLQNINKKRKRTLLFDKEDALS